jgi:hypothetical protein
MDDLIIDTLILYMTMSYRISVYDALSAIHDVTGSKQAIHDKYVVFFLFPLLVICTHNTSC